jgi:hypothetical protein
MTFRMLSPRVASSPGRLCAADLLTSKAGIATAPLIIVAVVVAYLTIRNAVWFPRPRRAPPRRPLSLSPPSAPSQARPAQDQGDADSIANEFQCQPGHDKGCEKDRQEPFPVHRKATISSSAASKV